MKKMKKINVLPLIALLTWACLPALGACKTDAGQKGQVAIEDIETPPTRSPEDDKFADVYKPLDGTWRGKFNIYVHADGQAEGPARPRELDPEAWKSPPFKLSQTIDVQQVYTSSSPTFQRVAITDTLPDGRVIESVGVNKIQDGRMYCVVKKPDDLVIHDGATEGPGTILWSRDRKDPQAVEFFRETVEADRYTIVGWGYYGGADTPKAPSYYFQAAYERVQ